MHGVYTVHSYLLGTLEQEKATAKCPLWKGFDTICTVGNKKNVKSLIVKRIQVGAASESRTEDYVHTLVSVNLVEGFARKTDLLPKLFLPQTEFSAERR